jgi:hypothetical protein
MKLSIKANDNITRNTAENALARALQFLRAVGSDPAIMTALKGTGFSDSAQKQGWALVLSAYSAGNGPAPTLLGDAPLTEATSKVETWQATMFPRAHAVLRRFYPDQGTFVFENIEMESGITAVPAVATFLDRLDALESSPDRKATRKVDHAALAMLAERGVTKDERKDMRSTVKWIESTPAEPIDANPQKSPRDAALLAVYDWVQDWAECARTVIVRRDQLIRLGIGRRRARKVVGAPTTPTPTPSPSAPVVTPPTIAPTPPVLALPPATNGATPGSISISAGGQPQLT